MGDNGNNNRNNEEPKKKNPAPVPRSVKRRKKKGPAASVKVPQGNGTHNFTIANKFNKQQFSPLQNASYAF